MRFVLYNIRYATGHSLRWPWSGYLAHSDEHLRVIARFLRDLSPDILGLVEVDSGSYRTRYANQIEFISRELGFEYIWRTKYGEEGWWQRVPVLNRQANAILTRMPTVRERFHYFDRGQKRLVIEAQLPEISVFLVHLALSFRTRQSQLADLYDLVRSSDRPCVVAGDFNSFFGNREVRLFIGATGLKSANPRHVPTYPSWRPTLELDYVLYSSQLRVKSFAVPLVPFSDHLPIVCDFELHNKSEPANVIPVHRKAGGRTTGKRKVKQ